MIHTRPGLFIILVFCILVEVCAQQGTGFKETFQAPNSSRWSYPSEPTWELDILPYYWINANCCHYDTPMDGYTGLAMALDDICESADSSDCNKQSSNAESCHLSSVDVFGYGTYEMLAQISTPNNVDTLDCLGLYNDVPNHIEIDFCFHSGQDASSADLAYYNSNNNNPINQAEVPLGFDTRSGYHHYQFNWFPNSIEWFADGKQIWTTQTEQVPADPMSISLIHRPLTDQYVETAYTNVVYVSYTPYN
eukprot:TRINITY_DN4510_c0_g1_i1.p1 TRINITY_DN4510_c0_g1~~TRINITY_DN4510_c0_g1_i1.p1  ORF type:complete len:250 (+),score=15.75 TRINITY_DN4510_c0_g1_i1:3-752(+)